MLIFAIFLLAMLKKLVPNVFDKQKYMLCYEYLQLYLRLGLTLKTIHCILEFNHSQWLKSYVETNTHKRIETKKKKKKRKTWEMESM